MYVCMYVYVCIMSVCVYVCIHTCSMCLDVFTCTYIYIVESSLPEKPKENMDQVDQVAQCPGGQEGSAPLSFLVV